MRLAAMAAEMRQAADALGTSLAASVYRAARALARLQQPLAELREWQRRQEARCIYAFARLAQRIYPDLHVELVTTESEGCRVVVQRLGGWR